MSQPTMTHRLSATGAGIRDIANRLYRGEAGIDVVGKRKIYYSVAAVILLVAIVTFIARPFNYGIEFKGGNAFTVPASVGTLDEVRSVVEQTGAQVGSAQVIGGTTHAYLIKTAELDTDSAAASRKAEEIKAAISQRFGIPVSDISENAVSGAWGAQITQRALIGTVIFLVLVVLYLALVFREWRMAVAALAALIQNLVLTAAVYLLIGFEVTPSTVIGFLTILGFALYDVVVVFDKVRENTRSITASSNQTYGEAANLAVNQTLMRSINTAVVALLPVGGLLFIGAGLLGAGTLKDLGLVLFVGMLAAVYSSIFFATPVLVDLMEAQPRYRLHRQRVLARRVSLASGERRAPIKVGPAKVGQAKASQAKAGQPKGGTKTAAGAKAIEADPAPSTLGHPDDESLDPGAETAPSINAALSGAPRTGARPPARKRSGPKPGAKPSGRSGGRRR